MIVSNHLSLPQFFAMQLPLSGLCAFFAFACTISAGLAGVKGTQFLLAIRYLTKVCREAAISTRKITNPKLLQALKKGDIVILVSSAVRTPTAYGKKTILFPLKLVDQLSQDEFEAVIAHEVEHLRWKDPHVKVGCILIKAVFWWIPTAWWLKRIESDQEQACDASIRRYGYAGVALASAVVKTLKLRDQQCSYEMVLSQLASRKSDFFMRIQALLQTENVAQGWTKLSRCGMGAVIVCFLLIGFRIC